MPQSTTPVVTLTRHTPVASSARTDAVPTSHWIALLGFWLAIYFVSLFAPPLLDDADATHAEAARAMLSSADWVTLHVDGVRYLEKPPLPYWLVAISFRLFGFNAFAAHLPGALAVLALTALGYLWARQVFGSRTALYTGLASLTCTGVFLFTRVFIPEVLFSLFLCIALCAFQQCLEQPERGAPFMARGLRHGWGPAYLAWTFLALAVLTKGFVALIFFIGTAAIYVALTGQAKHWGRLRPLSGIALFLLIAAPWHILASLRNTHGAGGHGFAWFYFINEHVLRFLGRRTPRDYNRLPPILYWSLHLVWLFPWSLFAPLAAIFGWHNRGSLTRSRARRTTLLLAIYSALVISFFSLSTNQEYYTFPAYLPLLLLVCAGLAKTEESLHEDRNVNRWLLLAHATYAITGAAAAIALAYALWTARAYPRPDDLGALLAHRGVGAYTLSMSSFFDLTGRSFAGLRLPAMLAMLTLATGPGIAWMLRRKSAHFAATCTVAATSAVFLIAAHIALARFAPMLSSKDFADRITTLNNSHSIAPDTQVYLFGDQAYGSSLAFYLNHPVILVDGRTTSMYFGSTFADAPPVFITSQQLVADWGRGPRKIVFIPIEHRAQAERLLADSTLIAETSGKLLLTDRPLTTQTLELKTEPHVPAAAVDTTAVRPRP